MCTTVGTQVHLCVFTCRQMQLYTLFPNTGLIYVHAGGWN